MPDIQPQPMPEVIRRFNTSQRRELAKIARSNRQLGPRTVIVQPGDDIQSAINSIANDGGGVVFLKEGTHILTADISGKTEVSIVGEGRDLSIIECNGNAYGLDYTGTAETQLKNFRLADFTIQNSNNTAGIDIDFCDFWKMENVRVTSCDQDGIRIERCQNYIINNVRSDNNTGNGINFFSNSSSNRDHRDFSLFDCVADTNGGDGFLVTYTSYSGTDMIRYFQFIRCVSNSNTGAGFNFTGGSTGFNLFSSCIGCGADSNTGNGFTIALTSITFYGCQSTNNGVDGFDLNNLATRGVIFVACQSSSNTGLDWDISMDSNVSIVGNQLGGTLLQPSSKFDALDAFIQSVGNFGGGTKTEKRVLVMQNGIGAQINQGEVVIIKSDASGEVVTTTTTAGDDKVFGMSLATTSIGGWTPILVEGFTTRLKVNGTTDIAIGDFLATFTSAGIAAKAAAGDMCFAIALEAYATDDSNGVIDALIISPRLI